MAFTALKSLNFGAQVGPGAKRNFFGPKKHIFLVCKNLVKKICGRKKKTAMLNKLRAKSFFSGFFFAAGHRSQKSQFARKFGNLGNILAIRGIFYFCKAFYRRF